ncbi:hypothetical protein CONCODRAFT_15910 [Conidiobolus coronatus NRRL 28638]|uniref:Coiled-coil domain-containing protein 58 n=1 Tax=Conidiobolus coronatus (strain ATCC 28846 / CBS 209.66 / NRRL 28638) TaxID=796925 RepID=A0A137PCZ2_CONC2|nr:hypothetical protein CONCODRAFT_15910 [Conidiobolus coronatus NRRL 28638]|eukprot:KXN72811.1 hypothetical protein CONCODRAFT_15910 [Conidiobolus coronatus NRRL 28638]
MENTIKVKQLTPIHSEKNNSISAEVKNITIDQETCFNLSYFKDTLKLLRKADDNIILRLNRITTSDKEGTCDTLFEQLSTAYKSREDTINYCYNLVNENLKAKKSAIEKDPQNTELKSHLYSEEAKLRWVRNERDIEEIIKDRSLKVFRERCYKINQKN